MLRLAADENLNGDIVRGLLRRQPPLDIVRTAAQCLGGEKKLRCWFPQPYFYGMMVCMKKTLNVDDKLFREAKLACQAATDTETVRLGLEALVRHAAYERLRALRGSEPQARDVPRRREKRPTKRKVA